jgi:hypothetical protein
VKPTVVKLFDQDLHVGQKYCFLKLFFFIPGPFQGGHFFGEILDLKPAFLNLRPVPPLPAPTTTASAAAVEVKIFISPHHQIPHPVPR